MPTKSTGAAKAQSRKRSLPPPRPVSPTPDDPSTWPVLWRVVAPCAGSFNHDMVFTETEDEQDARASFRGARRSGWPVRLERVSCGPLPPQAATNIVFLRATNAQNPGGEGRPLLAAWEARS